MRVLGSIVVCRLSTVGIKQYQGHWEVRGVGIR